jgi:dihydroxyacetone kinase-like predicted kinase
MEFGYCTEVLLRLQTAKTDVDAFSVQTLVDFLNSVGDSVVAVKTGTAVKLHVHTLTPWKVLEYCQQYGEYLTVKIENMTLQHNETQGAKEQEKPKRPRKPYAVVAVASGEGLKRVFADMGADAVVSGGQTNNPSAEDFIKAFDEVNADCIFVLPNNGNIVMAAKQAASIYQGSKIRVVESKNVGEGYSALGALDYDLDDEDEIALQMTAGMAETKTGMVARAVRDAELNGVKVEKDGYMGFTDGLMLLCEKTRTDAAVAHAEKLGVKEKEFVIAVYGDGVTDGEKAEFVSRIEKQYRDVEVFGIDGGQEVYDFLLILE